MGMQLSRAVVLLWVAGGCNQAATLPAGGPPGQMMADAGGGPATGGVTFAVFGDARPKNPNDTANYPTAIVAGNFTQMQAKGAQFVVGTGDYMFADSGDAVVSAQLDLLLQGEKNFTNGPIYHTMGNHECTGATVSNCPTGTETANVKAYLALERPYDPGLTAARVPVDAADSSASGVDLARLVPEGVTTPYFRIDVDTAHGKAKLVFVAANAWSDAQATWLQQQMADPTTYTFVVRHEAASLTDVPGVSPSEAIIGTAPLTLELLGHSHEYRKLDAQHVISGNGGAPISSGGKGGSSGYGFLLIQELDSGDLAVSEVDEVTGNVIDTWKVTADGRPGT